MAQQNQPSITDLGEIAQMPMEFMFKIEEVNLWPMQSFCVQFRITLKSKSSQHRGRRTSFTVQLNSRPVRRIELYSKVCRAPYQSFIKFKDVENFM